LAIYPLSLHRRSSDLVVQSLYLTPAALIVVWARRRYPICGWFDHSRELAEAEFLIGLYDFDFDLLSNKYVGHENRIVVHFDHSHAFMRIVRHCFRIIFILGYCSHVHPSYSKLISQRLKLFPSDALSADLVYYSFSLLS